MRMTENFQHEDGIIECRSIFAGPCSCGPAVHINLERVKGEIAATAALTLDQCEGLIKQIRASMKAVRKAQH